MPDGVMEWFDTSTGRGVVVHDNRHYPVVLADVDPHARHNGARVHFDVVRDGDGERAINVLQRVGARTGHRHERVGTLQGARAADAPSVAALERLHPELARSVAQHPIELVLAWADALTRGDAAAARSFYAPGARLHLDSDRLVGPATISGWLESHATAFIGATVKVRGSKDRISAVFSVPDRPSETLAIESLVAHGLIEEQWLLGPSAAPTLAEVVTPTGPIALATTVIGAIDPEAVGYARQRLTTVAELVTAEPILGASVVLEHATDPARVQPELVRASINVNGTPVRAHVAAHTMHEAIDLVEARLRERLVQRASYRRALRHRGGEPTAGEWQHDDLPTARPEYFDRPVDERELLRAKIVTSGPMTLDEAIFDLNQRDYDFYLYEELESGSDAVVERADGSYLLRRLDDASELEPSVYPVTRDPRPIPTLSVDEAIEYMNLEGAAYVIFRSARTDRASVCYRRYDGHYGLLACA